MAVIYYPKNQLIYIRDTTTSGSTFESVYLNTQPNTIIYFDTSSMMQGVNASLIPITASWAMTASLSTVIATTVIADSASWSSASLSSSYAGTASFALNGGGGGSATASAYTTIMTSSLNWITMSFLDQEEFVNISVGALYNFTCSNVASSSQVMSTTLYINNTATATSSLAFPANWVFMGTVPTYISTSKSAVLSLRNYGGALNVAAFATQY
jgi:hypothetical protein